MNLFASFHLFISFFFSRHPRPSLTSRRLPPSSDDLSSSLKCCGHLTRKMVQPLWSERKKDPFTTVESGEWCRVGGSPGWNKNIIAMLSFNSEESEENSPAEAAARDDDNDDDVYVNDEDYNLFVPGGLYRMVASYLLIIAFLHVYFFTLKYAQFYLPFSRLLCNNKKKWIISSGLAHSSVRCRKIITKCSK